jgi:ATP-binding cassette subfamily B protein
LIEQRVLSPLLHRLGFRDSGTLKLVWRLFSANFWNHWRSYLLAVGLMVITAGTTAYSARIIKDVVDEIFIARNLSMLVPLSMAIIGLSLTKGFASYFQEVVMGRIGNRIVAENQRRVYDHLLKFGAGHFTTQSSSSLIMVVSSGANAVRDVLNMVVLSVGRDFLTLFALLSVMIVQAPFLAIIALVVAPIAITGVTRLMRRVRHIARAEFMLGTRLIQTIQETVQGAVILKAFNLSPYMSDRMNQAIAALEQRANKINRLQARTGPLMEALGGISIGLVTLYSGWATIVGGHTPGDFMAFITAFLLAYEPAKRLARLHVNLESSMVGVRAIFGILDEVPGPTEISEGPPLAFTSGTIEFHDVTFAYRRDTPVLNGLNFRIESDSKVALVGPSGGGKTTMLALIPRLYDVDSGAVTIDGQDLRDVPAESVRRHIALVSQDTFLFGGTVRENIRIGRLDAGDAEVEAAGRDAHAHDFIAALKDGYDTNVGENGVQLSGGQRQRIAIARAFLKRAPIILLDEATSALDSESERQVQLALDRLMEGRTIIVIAHRLSTILNADRILVVDGGRIVEEGTHRELLAKGGLYESLYRHQFAEKPERPRLVSGVA